MSEKTKFNDYAIVGLGLIGGSIAKDIRTKHPESSIYAIDTDQNSIDAAISEGVIDGAIGYDDLPYVSHLTILAPPIDFVEESARSVSRAFQSAHRRIFEKHIVIDTASIKSPIASVFQDLSRTTEGVEFLATHPMAGTEYSGFRHARKDLFRAKPWIISPHAENSEETVKLISNLVSELGAKIRIIDPDTHDQHAGLVSHAVILLSNALFDFVATNHPDALDMAGDGFISTTRLASGNPELHKSIIQSNSDITEAHLEEFIDYLKSKIGGLPNDDESLLSYFTENMNRRNSWLRKRK